MPPDTSHTQKAAALARGKATVGAPTCSGTMAVARPISSGSTPRNRAAVEWRVKRRRAVSGSKISLPEASASSKSTSAPATPDATRNSSEVPTKSLPMVRGSPDPTTAASPVGGVDGVAVAAASAAASREASVTVMNAPWSGDGLCSGI